MMTKLFIYILCHRQKEITVQELAEALWEEDESDNPAGALKNLMYRLRSLIKKTWGRNDFILTGRSAYIWNQEIPVSLDIETFESNIKEAARQTDSMEKIALYNEAAALYKGAFLPKFASEYWVASQSTYYHTTYLGLVKKLAVLLENEGRYSEMASSVNRAIQIDNLDESLHCCFIRALMGQDNYKQAIEHYQVAEKTLYDYLGVTPSEELRALYETIIKKTHRNERDITAVQNELMEDRTTGAFVCEYGAFQRIYRLQARQGERMGISIFLLLATISGVPASPDGETDQEIIRDAMVHLEDVLRSSLRSGDPVAQYSSTQYVALLPTCQYETAKMVTGRIEKSFWNNYKNKQIRLRFDLDELHYE
ncbi:BTAD domain-containing putative transcriptional regulator [Eubacterium sp. 1001713B170207_170306_E7]|uniref:BTAD domain-containing putative transcriptional regulator n=1 Tax=Eubacterium sp. 1001713B170207_170306_E7 TaxID=2787097 RepID=UPI001898B44F|nr:BTAD domain-containing putative transcriptional regulator [Eubacterium sp. 1001713B170207_170306_E7]